MNLTRYGHDIIPVLATIVTMSSGAGIVSSHLKGAHVMSVIKKPSLDKDMMNNFKPVSNQPTCCCCETDGSHVSV